jgi:hypothetical protein
MILARFGHKAGVPANSSWSLTQRAITPWQLACEKAPGPRF